MKESENYLQLLVTEYKVKSLTSDDFRNTLEYYAKIYHDEKTKESN